MAELIQRKPKQEAEEQVKKTAEKAADAGKKAKETVKKEVKEAAPKKQEQKPAAEKKPEKKPQTIEPKKPTGGSTIGLRIGAVVLWILAIVCEVFAIMALLEYMIPPFGMSMMLFLIIMIVLDMAFAILAAQLWKKANHIKPMSEKRGKFLFYLWNELGVIMACICFIPLIVMLIKNDKLDKKTKVIATIIAIVALLITGVASADWNPISAEQKEEAENSITSSVYWTQFGHKYHLKWNGDENAEPVENDCPYIRNSSAVYKGPVAEAIEAGRTAICSYCAAHAASDWGMNLNLDALNVEDKQEVLEEVKDQLPEVVDTTEAR
jgi:hypothetical protein